MREKTKFGNRILEGAVSLTVATVIVKLLGAVYKIPLAHILGEEGMGYFNSAYTVYSFFYLLCTAGVPKAIMILVGNARNENDADAVNSIVKTAFCFFAVSGAVITLIFTLGSAHLSEIIGSKNSYKSMLAIAPSILLVSVSGVLRGYLSADEKFIHIAVSQIVDGAGRLVLGLLFADIADKMCMPLNTVSAFTIFGATCGSLLGLIYLLISSNKLELHNKTRQILRKSASNVIKRVLKISFPITVSAAVMSITNMIDLSLIMRRLLSLGYSESEATALYGNYTTYATPIFNMLLSLITSITIVFFPQLIKEKRVRLNFSKVLEQELSLIFFFAVPATLGTCLYSRQILYLLFGSDGIEVGAVLLSYLSVSLIFAVPLIVINSALEAKGKIKAPMISMLVGSAVKVLVSYFLIGNSRFGIIGAPLGTACSYAVALIISFAVLQKCARPCVSLYKSLILPSINSIIAVGGIYVIYLRFCNDESNIAFIFTVIVTVTAYFLVSNAVKVEGRTWYVKKQNAQRNA